MKSALTFIILTFSVITFAQKSESQEAKHPVGIGLRVGDFNGLSAQYFLTKARMSVGLDVGRSYFFGDNYEKRFDLYATKNDTNYVGYDKNGTNEGASYGFKFNICKYGLIGKVPHFYWYAGAGFQMRRFILDHEYSVERTAAHSNVVKQNDETIDGVQHQSYGIDFIIGSEYVFQEFPMTVFVDITTFVEAAELSGQLMGQMGLGARFHF